MDTYNATIADDEGNNVGIGCGASSLRAADIYFSSALPDGWHLVAIQKIIR